MTQRNLTLEDLARLITNRDNPKTMDFYFWRFMGLADTDNFINNMQVLSNGEFEVLLKSNAKTLAAAFSLTDSVVNFNVYYRGLNNTKNTANKPSLFFVMSMFPEKVFPKCRDIKIMSSRTYYELLVNPRAGETTTISTPSGYSYSRLEPDLREEKKYLVAYSRSKWLRRGKLNINEESEKTPA